MPASRDQTGRTLLTDCDAFMNENAGCGVAGTRVILPSTTTEAVSTLWNVRNPPQRPGFGLGMAIHLVKSGMETARSTGIGYLGEFITRKLHVASVAKYSSLFLLRSSLTGSVISMESSLQTVLS